MLSDKPGVFDALTVHRDEIATLPAGATVLATNEMSRVQALTFRFAAGSFAELSAAAAMP